MTDKHEDLCKVVPEAFMTLIFHPTILGPLQNNFGQLSVLQLFLTFTPREIYTQVFMCHFSSQSQPVVLQQIDQGGHIFFFFFLSSLQRGQGRKARFV